MLFEYFLYKYNNLFLGKPWSSLQVPSLQDQSTYFHNLGNIGCSQTSSSRISLSCWREMSFSRLHIFPGVSPHPIQVLHRGTCNRPFSTSGWLWGTIPSSVSPHGIAWACCTPPSLCPILYPSFPQPPHAYLVLFLRTLLDKTSCMQFFVLESASWTCVLR